MKNTLLEVTENLAPVVIFVYNRPLHTRNTLNALAANKLALNTPLFVYSDGPCNNMDQQNVKKVREIIAEASGFQDLVVINEPVNKGLAKSIIDGVTEICREYGKVIVLEDDLITSPFFLNYMNTALQRYADDNRVMHVSGYLLPVRNKFHMPDAFFFRNTTCWGWGTWWRAWQSFNSDAKALAEEIRNRKLKYKFDIDGYAGSYRMLKDQAAGRINSWAIRWYASVFLQGGLCLHPGKSMVKNIGHDGTGVHSNNTDVFNGAYAEQPVSFFPEIVEESSIAVDAIADFYKRLHGGWIHRLRRKASTLLSLRSL